MASVEEFGTGESRGPRIPSYLVQSILTALLFLPVGIVAVIFSISSSSKLSQGDHEGARASSEKARAWAITAYWLGVIVLTINLIGFYIFYSFF